MIGNERPLFGALRGLGATASLAIIFICGVTTRGQQTPVAPAAQPVDQSSRAAQVGYRSSSEARYRIGPGDILDVRILNKPQFNREGVRVNPRGTIRMPLLKGDIKVACRTEEEAENQITELLKEYVLDPQVTVQIREYLAEPVALLGAIRSPSRFQLQRRVRLLELLTFGNGPADNAGMTIQVVHTEPAMACTKASEEQPDDPANLASQIDYYKLADTLRNEANANPWVMPGDVISIAPADQVYVIGNVIRPSTIALTEAMTVSRAIAMAGGTQLDTQKSKIHVIRQIPGKPDKDDIVIDLEAINRRKAPDFVLVANDIVEVPASGGKRFFRSLMGSVIPNVASLPIRVIP